MRILCGVIGGENERGTGGQEYSKSIGAGAPVIDPVGPNGQNSSPWPHVATLAGANGDWIDFRNYSQSTASLCDTWVGRARNYTASMLVTHGSYVISGVNIYRAIGAYAATYTLNVAPSSGVGTSGLTSWDNLGAVTVEDVDGVIYTENSARFDPNGLLNTLLGDFSPRTGYDKKAIYLSLAHTDYTLGVTRSQYALAIQSIVGYFTRRLIHIFIGFPAYANVAGLDANVLSTLLPGRADALSALSTNDYVKPGADLRTLLGVIPDYPALTADGKMVGLKSGNILLNAQGIYQSAVRIYEAIKNTAYVQPTVLGLSVQGTSFIKNGVPFKGYGVFHFSLFQEELINIAAGGNYKIDIPAIKALHIPFIHTVFALYNAADILTHWVNARNNYLKTLDLVVKKAEDEDVGLIPYLSFGLFQIHKVVYTVYGVQETPKDLASTSSYSWRFFRDFISTIVSRYKDSKAIYGWNLGDEDTHHLGSELHPSWAVDGTFAAWVNWGARPWGGNYVAADKLTLAGWRTFTSHFVQLVKSLDPHNRIIFSGDAEPYPFAVNATLNGTTTSDTYAQRQSYLGTNYNDYRSASFDVHNVNEVPQSLADNRSYLGDEKTAGGLIAHNKALADAVNKPFVCGSYGAAYKQSADGVSTDLASEQANFYDMLNALVANDVKLSALWVYDGAGAKASSWMEFNVTEPDKVYQLNAIRDLNIALGH